MFLSRPGCYFTGIALDESKDVKWSLDLQRRSRPIALEHAGRKTHSSRAFSPL